MRQAKKKKRKVSIVEQPPPAHKTKSAHNARIAGKVLNLLALLFAGTNVLLTGTKMLTLQLAGLCVVCGGHCLRRCQQEQVDVCSRMLTNAHVCSRMLAPAISNKGRLYSLLKLVLEYLA